MVIELKNDILAGGENGMSQLEDQPECGGEKAEADADHHHEEGFPFGKNKTLPAPESEECGTDVSRETKK